MFHKLSDITQLPRYASCRTPRLLSLSPFVLIKQYDADDPGFVAEYAHGCDPALFTNDAFASEMRPTLYHIAFRAEPDRRLAGGAVIIPVNEETSGSMPRLTLLSLHQTDSTLLALYGRCEFVVCTWWTDILHLSARCGLLCGENPDVVLLDVHQHPSKLWAAAQRILSAQTMTLLHGPCDTASTITFITSPSVSPRLLQASRHRGRENWLNVVIDRHWSSVFGAKARGRPFAPNSCTLTRLMHKLQGRRLYWVLS